MQAGCLSVLTTYPEEDLLEGGDRHAVRLHAELLGPGVQALEQALPTNKASQVQATGRSSVLPSMRLAGGVPEGRRAWIGSWYLELAGGREGELEGHLGAHVRQQLRLLRGGGLTTARHV